MKVNLAEVAPGKPLKRTLTVEKRELQTGFGTVLCKQISLNVLLQIDPLGYALKYEMKADAGLTCVRCGEALEHRIEIEDWLSLRKRHPTEHHVVLDASEMNIRFISESRFDLEKFADEVLELECPAYPKHEDACGAVYEDTTQDEAKNDSPFSCLSDLIAKS